MKKSGIIVLYSLLALSLAACVKIKKTDAEYERENWIASFSDSIQYYQEKTGDIERKLDNVNKDIAGMLSDFEKVNNPREVTGYYLLQGWKSKLPFTTTGIYARINENEKLELIATLAGGTFNQLEVGNGNDVYSTEVVPHDQAFNYRHTGYNTVYFSSGKADTVAQYIAEHYKDKVNLEYLEGSKKKIFVIPENEREMIKKTWDLYHTQSESRHLQKELMLTTKKIDTFHRILDDNAEKNTKP